MTLNDKSSFPLPKGGGRIETMPTSELLTYRYRFPLPKGGGRIETKPRILVLERDRRFPLPKGGGRIETRDDVRKRLESSVSPCRKAGGGLKPYSKSIRGHESYMDLYPYRLINSPGSSNVAPAPTLRDVPSRNDDSDDGNYAALRPLLCEARLNDKNPPVRADRRSSASLRGAVKSPVRSRSMLRSRQSRR